MDEREYVRRLVDEAHDTVDMLSSHRKAERERRAAAAFLRCLGVDFSPDELITPESDPPDVIFQDARFEVTIKLDKGRKFHADWKKKANQRNSAKSLDDLTTPYHPSVPIPFRKVVSLVFAELEKKASHYGPETCSRLDALLYINLLGRHLYPLSEAYAPKKTPRAGLEVGLLSFRSVQPCALRNFGSPRIPAAVRGEAETGVPKSGCDV